MAPRAAPIVAVGILSAPEFTERRMGVRASWLRWPDVSSGLVAARFALRCLDAPPWLEHMLQLEERRYSDTVCLGVAHNETRLRGPVLMLAAWLAHAPRAFPTARFVAKVDDDSYVHLPRLVGLLRNVPTAYPSVPHVYIGKLAWFHWHAAIFEHAGFGYERTLANAAGRVCRNASSETARRYGACVGPFPFAAGYLIVLSAPLASALTASTGMRADVDRLRRASRLSKLNGKRQIQVMEDVWLASLLYRFPAQLGPVSYVTLGEGGREDRPLISDGWGLKTTRTAVLVHVRSKATERLITTHDFMQSLEPTCRVALRLQCPQHRGCAAFVTNNEFRRRRLLRRTLATGRELDAYWRNNRDWWAANGWPLAADFCRGAGAQAQYCRLGMTAFGNCSLEPGNASDLERRLYYVPVDLLRLTRGESVIARAQSALAASQELLAAVSELMPADRVAAALARRRVWRVRRIT